MISVIKNLSQTSNGLYNFGLSTGDDSPKLPDTEIGPGSNELKMTVGRNELGSTFTCKVSSPALDEPLTVDIKLDIHGKQLHNSAVYPRAAVHRRSVIHFAKIRVINKI